MLVHVQQAELVALAFFLVPHAFFSFSRWNILYNDRVPLGFVCGYPLSGGELYGGSMYISSAATDTLQGRAMQRINTTWGDDGSQQRQGRESLGGPVCKKKYKPFLFRLVQVPLQEDADDEPEMLRSKTRRTGTSSKSPPTVPSASTCAWQVQVERLYGCACHHELRRQTILRYGERPGWEPFGQWSLKKALQRAKQETIRLNSLAAALENGKGANARVGSVIACEDVDDVSTEGSTVSAGRGTKKKSATTTSTLKLLPLCSNGDCLWKVKTAYDDIAEEIQESLPENGRRF